VEKNLKLQIDPDFGLGLPLGAGSLNFNRFWKDTKLWPKAGPSIYAWQSKG
jgi:hypothetical protein